MANEIFNLGFPSGYTLYAIIRNSAGQVWYPTGEEFEDWGTSSRSHADYDIPLTDESGGIYLADFPSAIPANTSLGYRTIIFRQLGANPASTDQVLGGARIYWTGSSEAGVDTELNATSVANRAFAKLGGTKGPDIIISDIDDTSDENAVAAKAIYSQVRNEVLVRWPWNECREYADLGSETTVTAQADWEYVFALPSNYLAAAVQIDEEDHTIKHNCEVRGLYLYTNTLSNSDGDSAYIDYVKKVTDASEYSPALFESIATKLAAELAPRYKPQEKDNLKREYEFLVLPNAKATNQESQYEDDKGSYSWRDARTS